MIQRLEPSSSWRAMALQEAAKARRRSPDELLLAQVVHTAIVHDELEDLPPLVSVAEWTAHH